jgi:hypothetical protein
MEIPTKNYPALLQNIKIMLKVDISGKIPNVRGLFFVYKIKFVGQVTV